MYCQHCGNPIADAAEAEEAAAEELADASADVAESVSTAEVEIARIQADRDITLAKIDKGILADALEAQDAENAVKAELLDAAMEPPEPEPVVLEVPDADPGPPAEEPPPEVDAVPEPAGKSSRNVWWS